MLYWLTGVRSDIASSIDAGITIALTWLYYLADKYTEAT